MEYLTVLTQKNQITIRNDLKKMLRLKSYSKVKVLGKKTHIEIYPQSDFIELAESLKITSSKNALEAREQMEESYTKR